MFITIILFVVILGLLIFAHELGHFYTARKFGVKVEEFGFGYPPKIWGKEYKGTVYSINWIPFGGFVKIKGEGGEHQNEIDSFASQKAYKRSIILSAGVLMNIIFAFALLTIGFGIGLPAAIDDDNSAQVRDLKIQIMQVEDNSPAAIAKLQSGDEIVSIDGQTFSSTMAITDYVRQDNDNKLFLTVKRLNNTFDILIELPSDKKVMGVYLVKTGLVSYPWWQAIYEGFKATFYIAWQIIYAFYLLLAGLFGSGGSSLEVSGPVGVAVLTGQMARLGFSYLLQFTALLSINLAIINILPIPALDGGRLLFILIEKIRGQKMKEKTEAIIHNLFFFALVGLMFFITGRDLFKYGGKILNVFSNLF